MSENNGLRKVTERINGEDWTIHIYPISSNGNTFYGYKIDEFRSVGFKTPEEARQAAKEYLANHW